MSSDLTKLKVGQQVVLIIGVNGNIEGDYIGTVSAINKEKTSVHLRNVVFGPTQQKFSGEKLFYLPEILEVDIISDIPDDSGKKRTTESIDHQLKFELNAKEKEIIQRLVENHCMIETVGEAFDKALQDIYHYYYVGLTVHMGKSGYLVCSTSHKIYVFNIRRIGGLNGKFKEWLESDTQIKVVHGAHILERDLFRCYRINIKGIFDTKLLHEMMTSRIEMPSQLQEETNSRTACQIDTLIDRTAILLKFHDFLTECLLKDVYRLSQMNLDYCRNKPSIEVQQIYRSGKSIVSELPAEPYLEDSTRVGASHKNTFCDDQTRAERIKKILQPSRKLDKK